MSVYKKPGSKYWWYTFVFKGKSIQKSTKVENEREAVGIEKGAWVQLARGEVDLEDKPEPERKSLGQLLDVLLEDFQARKKDTAKNRNLIAKVKEELGNRYADSFHTREAKEYVQTLRKGSKAKTKGRRSKSLADSTVKHRLRILASAFELENITREEEGFKPLQSPRWPKLSDGNERSGFLSRAQFDLLLSHLPKDLRDYCLFGYLVGWRKAAIAGLEWSDVRDGNVYLRGVLSKNKKPYYVPILGELMDLIERRRQVRSVKVNGTTVVSNLVFHRAGEPVQEFRKAWITATKKAGLAGIIFHDLRRSAARNLIRSGVDRDTAKRLGGWKTDSIFTRYNVTGEEDLRDAMERVTKYNEAESQKIVSIAN
jgi:integrase